MVTILHVKDYADIAHTGRLFIELAATCLDFATLSKGVQDGLEDQPHAYAPPEGCLHLAIVDKHVAGFSVVKKAEQHTCELKLLYVFPRFRRQGIGKALTEAAINTARELGYKTVQLTTLPSMKNAIAIYDALGFKLVESKQKDSLTKALRMELALMDSDEGNLF